MLLGDIDISDGQVLEVQSTLSDLKIVFRDWREDVWSILFTEVLSFQSMSVEGQDLLSLEIVKEDEFKEKTMTYFQDEDSDRFLCYHFYDSWSDNALLKIIATEHYKIEKILTFKG